MFSQLSDSPSEWSNRTSLTLPTPASTVDKLTRDLEFTLDLQSALGGGRHIRTEVCRNVIFTVFILKDFTVYSTYMNWRNTF